MNGLRNQNQLAQYLAMYDKEMPNMNMNHPGGDVWAQAQNNSEAVTRQGQRMRWAQDMMQREQSAEPTPNFFGSQQQPAYVQPQQFPDYGDQVSRSAGPNDMYTPPPVGDYSAPMASIKRYNSGMMPQIQNYLAKLLGGR